MFSQMIASRFSAKKTVLMLLCCVVPAGAAASVLEIALPAILAQKNAGPNPSPHWRTAQGLAENLDSAWAPQLTADGAGNALAAWSQTGGFRSRRYQVGTGWLDGEYAGAGGGELQIAMNAKGKAAAVWTKYDGETNNAYLYTQLYTAGVGWDEATVIGSSGTPLMSPVVAMDSSGNVLAVWTKDSRPFTTLCSSRYEVNSSSWTSPVQMARYGADVTNPVLGMDAAGNAMLAWRQRGVNTYHAFADRYQVGAGWETPQSIEQDSGSVEITTIGTPHLSVNSTGNAVAVWQQSGENWGTWTNRYEAGTGWGDAQLLADNTGASDIALNSAGNAVAVWQQSDGTRTNIWASRYAVGTGWSTAELIETNDSGDAQGPKVAMDENGNAIVVWLQSDGTHTKIWANRYAVGSGWGAAQSIETENSDDADGPQLVMSATGKAVATWRQFDGAQYSIWANRFE